jgi:hypothetical protein
MAHNKHIRGEKSQYETQKTFNYIKYGEVMSVNDPNSMGRIKVWIKGSVSNGGDDEICGSNNDYEKLPWCLPMLPKHLSIQPKVGESVLIFVFSNEKENVDRMYMGPIISQLNKLDFDSARTTALAGFSFGPTRPMINITNKGNSIAIPELIGVFPDPEDVSIQGRYNTEITQKKNEIVLKAGKFVEAPIFNPAENPYPFVFNTATQGFIQIKNDAVIETTKANDTLTFNKTGTITNIVSSKINLITHGGSPKFNVTNQQNLISDEEMLRILSEAHQLPFGDILLQYLKLLKDAFLNHVHNGHGNKSTDLTIEGNKQAVKAFRDKAKELEDSMLSKNIRIN